MLYIVSASFKQFLKISYHVLIELTNKGRRCRVWRVMGVISVQDTINTILVQPPPSPDMMMMVGQHQAGNTTPPD